MNTTENISELRAKPHLSYSSISTYQKCSLQYKFSRIDRIQPEFTSDCLIFGSVLHSVIASLYQNKLEGTRLSLKQLQEIFQEEWKNSVKKEPMVKYKKGNDFDSLSTLGTILLEKYYETIFDKDDLQIIGIEEPFSLHLENIGVPIVGYVDLIFQDEAGNIVIVETKSSSKSYSDFQIDDNDQITLYQRFLKNNGYNDRNIMLRIDCLVKTKTPKVESSFTVRSPEDERRLTKKISYIWDAINKGVFIPNDSGYQCSSCCFPKSCRDWFSK